MTPIALFVYNRPEHLYQTLSSIFNNYGIENTKIFIFCDGPKNENDELKVNETKKIIKNISCNKNIISIFREKNYGLKNNITLGISEILSKFTDIIVLEDDHITSRHFYNLMTLMLNKYKDNKNLGTVSGHFFPIKYKKFYQYDICFTYRHSCWGWGTWREIWNSVNWNIDLNNIFLDDLENKKSFNRAGPDMTNLLKLERDGKINSWSIIFDYHMWKFEKLCAMPIVSHVQNIGLDGSGTHKVKDNTNYKIFSGNLDLKTLKIPEKIYADKKINDQIFNLHRENILKKLYRLIKK